MTCLQSAGVVVEAAAEEAVAVQAALAADAADAAVVGWEVGSAAALGDVGLRLEGRWMAVAAAMAAHARAAVLSPPGAH